jgi:hypothetical protein
MSLNDQIWATADANGNGVIETGAKAPADASKVVTGSSVTLKSMKDKIAARNNGALTFPNSDAAAAALSAEEVARLAGIR